VAAANDYKSDLGGVRFHIGCLQLARIFLLRFGIIPNLKGVGLIRIKIEELKSVDIRTVDPDTLIDLRDVIINQDLTREERMIDFIIQIKNPYCYKNGKAIIKTSYADTEASLEDKLESYFLSL